MNKESYYIILTLRVKEPLFVLFLFGIVCFNNVIEKEIEKGME